MVNPKSAPYVGGDVVLETETNCPSQRALLMRSYGSEREYEVVWR